MDDKETNAFELVFAASEFTAADCSDIFMFSEPVSPKSTIWHCILVVFARFSRDLGDVACNGYDVAPNRITCHIR